MNEIRSLYNVYRPKRFSDIVEQSTPVTTMENALASDQIANAYLLSGPRGTGKTSTARIFAKSLLCLERAEGDYNACGHCVSCTALDDMSGTSDFIEIDAASHRGIEDIRDLISSVSVSPRISQRKVVLIDEVHHLTSDACTALLKVLEEPPSGVVFILATTNPMKLPETIRSRCQWLRFKTISLNQIIAHLETILAERGVSVESGVCGIIARQSHGGMRDALSCLDVLLTYAGSKTITVDDAEKCFGAVSQALLIELCNYVNNKDVAHLVGFSLKNASNDYSPKDIILGFADVISQALTASQTGNIAIGAESEYSEKLNSYSEKFASSMQIKNLVYIRDVIERDLWKFDNASLDQNHVFNETILKCVFPEYNMAVPGISMDIENKLDAVLSKNDKIIQATNGLIELIKKLIPHH